MRFTSCHRGPLLATISAAVLAACGGGGGSSAPAVPPAPSTAVFSGRAASGTPMAGASLRIYDRTGASVCATTVAADGSYRCELPSSAQAPFVIEAELDGQKLYSTFAELKSTTLNVTPITNLIAARLASNGDPGKLRDDVVATPEAVTAARLASKVDEITAVLQPLLAAAGSPINPLTGSFAADGAGHDRALDSLQISIRPLGNSANVEITVKSLPAAADAPPVAVKFNTVEATVPPIATPLRADDLVPSGTAALVNDLATRIAACYALPLAERISGGVVQAPACKSLFLDDDPASYLHEGLRVGPSGAFPGMFAAANTGMQLDRANFEYLTSEGDIVLSYHYRKADGFADFSVVHARRAGNTLKLVGNRALYAASVVPAVQQRDFINSPAFSYRSSGYNFVVGNRVDANGAPVFDKVEVSSPAGRLFTLRPTAGLSFLVVTRANGALTRSPGIKLTARYLDASTPGYPADKDVDPLFSEAPFSDEQLMAMKDHGVWKFEFFHADPNVPNRVQHVRTLTRAPTAAEMMALPMAVPTTAAKAGLVAQGNAAWGGTITVDAAPSAGSPNWFRFSAPGDADFWQVPEGAIEPYLITAFGFGPSPQPGTPAVFFNDNMNVAGAARQATLKCKPQTVADTHCDAALPDSYAAGARFTSLELLARTQRQMQLSHLTALWTLR